MSMSSTFNCAINTNNKGIQKLQTSTMASNSATTSSQSVDKMTGHDKKSSLAEGSLRSINVPTSLKKFRMSSSSSSDGFDSTCIKMCALLFNLQWWIFRGLQGIDVRNSTIQCQYILIREGWKVGIRLLFCL